MVSNMKAFYSLSLLILTSSFELVTDYQFIDKSHPVHFDGEFRNVFPADFHASKYSKAHYQDAHAFLYYSHYLTPDNALSWKAGYSFLKFDWPENPRFHEDNYHFLNGSLAWISTSLEDWRWILSGAASVDATTFNFGNTGVYYGLMWGRYRFSPTIGMHVGWAGYVGVKNGYLLPIIGIDYHPNAQWQINAIFPIDVSVTYTFAQHWSTSLEWATFGRPYRFPMRALDGVDGYKDGIFEVYSKGLEWDLNFQRGNTFSASVGAGWNFGGWIFIKDSHNHHGKYYKYESAPYVQGKLTCTF